ncbi:MAG TPA: amidohydrolase family protein [Candidatus Binataceae bacterium]|nr:amidohydrolase family protein [Candidatus Binataceae bacterium]
MSYDLLIRNGSVVDGTDEPSRRADVAIANGRIVEIGKITDSAKQVIDASDLIVAPGFIDPHTHYDAQICWDPYITSSSWHGITTVMMGNCGVGIAPCRPAVREIAAWDLVNVEGIPFEVLGKGIKWEWETFPQYLDAAQRRGSGINLGFLAPLTPFRHFVMGEESMERAATRGETTQIKALIKEAVAAGAFGFTTTAIAQHIGYKGRPLACRNASRDEFKAYANALKELGRGAMELALTKSASVLDDEEYEFLDLLLTESERPVTWLALVNRDDQPEACQDSLRKAEPLIRRGAIPQVTCRPLIIQIDLRNPFIFANLTSWNPVFNQPVEVQEKVYRDPGFRQAFRKELERPAVFNGKWERLDVKEVFNPAMKPLEGKNVAEVAKQRGKDGVDTFLDLALEDNLRIQFTMALFNADEDRIPELINDSRVMVGLSDGGAHVDMLCDAGYCTYLLGTWVRDRQVMSLERAIKRLTSEPADFFGIKNRGRLLPGMAADVVVFDYNTIGSARRGEMRNDLPGGGRRIVMPSRGIEHVIVNGQALYHEGKAGETLPGQVLRSGNC